MITQIEDPSQINFKHVENSLKAAALYHTFISI